MKIASCLKRYLNSGLLMNWIL